MIERILFHPKHLDLIQIRDEYRQMIFNSENAKYALNNIPGGKEGDALTLIIDGRIMACFGYFFLWEKTVQGWLLPSIYIQDHPIVFVRIIRRYLDQTAELFQWQRIQTVTEFNEKHRHWMKVLGFVEEGVMKKYFNNQDYIMSARYFERG